MAVAVVRLGSPRGRGEGPRLGTVRRPPRGVRREDYGRLDYYDLWLPELAPSAELLAYATGEPLSGRRWTQFARRYRAEMRQGPQQRLLALLAALSRQTSFAVGCYCEDESSCHRSLLRELLAEQGAALR